MCFLVQNNPRSRRGCAAGIIVEPQVSGDLVGLLAGALALDYWWLADSRLVNAYWHLVVGKKWTSFSLFSCGIH